MTGPPTKKARLPALPNVLDIDGFLIDIKVNLGGPRELDRVTESYSIASVEMLKKLLAVVPSKDIEWN